MKLILLTIRILFPVLCLILPLSAHQVETVEFEFQRSEKVWRLHGEMDIAYMLPETRGVPGGAPLSRKAVMKAAPVELERICRETENTLRNLLTFTYAGKPLKWRIEFPDFDKKPFELPEEYADWALLTVRLVVDPQPGPGDLVVHWSNKEKAELIVLTGQSEDAQIVSVQPGGKLALLKHAGSGVETGTATASKTATETTTHSFTSSFTSWMISGFKHVLPLGLDHMLFIFGLFVAVLSLRPMLWQSLLFTLAHSLTLALCALGMVTLEARWVEIFIAFSIAFIGIEDLFKCKVGMRRYVLVFVFGLVHGMGFANVLADKIKGVPKSQLAKPLLGFNLGVELAQITVILVASLIFWMLGKKRRKMGQTLGSIVVALGGLGWMIERIFFA